GTCDLDLFARAFADGPAFRTFCEQHQWDLEEIEYTYLERFAARHAGRFPEVLGPDYPPRGEEMLLARSRRLEEAGRGEAALAAPDALAPLPPRTCPAAARLARLCYRRGDLDRTADLLAQCHDLNPAAPGPLVRRAIVEQQRGNGSARTAAIDQ